MHFYQLGVQGRRIPIYSYFYMVVNPLTGKSFDLPPILDVPATSLQHIIVDQKQGKKIN